MVAGRHMAVRQIDSIVFAQAPKLTPYKSAMQDKLAERLNIDRQKVNVKATTTEGLGLIGNGEAIAAMCAAMVEKKG